MNYKLLLVIAFFSIARASQIEEKITKQATSEKIEKDEQCLSRQYQQRGLIAIIDQTGKGAAFTTLYIVLEQKIGPLLVSGKVLQRYITQCQSVDARLKNKDPELLQNRWLRLQEHLDQLRQRYNFEAQRPEVLGEIDQWVEKNKHSFESLPDQQEWEALIALRTFKPEDWLILNVDATNSLYLLIPHQFLQEIDSRYDKNSNKAHVNSQLAYRVGLRLDTMARITGDSIQNPTISSSNHFIEALPQLFITKERYCQEKHSHDIPAWTIYLLGHGEPDDLVAGISLKQFPQLLDFCESKIVTKLLVYNSCYSAGSAIQEIYADLKRPGSARTYGFPIAISALSDAPTRSEVSLSSSAFTVDGKLYALTNENFALFLRKALTASEIIDYRAILESIIPILSQVSFKKGRKSALTAAQIRLPGLPWFSVFDAQNRVVSLGKIITATREPAKPLNVLQFFNQQTGERTMHGPVAVLLYTPCIPFALSLDTIQGDLPHFVSMVPGETTHTLAGIRASSHGLQEVAELFELYDLEVKKDFIIEQLVVKNQHPIIDPQKSCNDVITVSAIIKLAPNSVIMVVQYEEKFYYLEPSTFSGAERKIIPVMLPENISSTDLFNIRCKELQSAQKEREGRLLGVSQEQLQTLAQELRAIHNKILSSSSSS